jgi:hypothetical protein
MHAAALYAWELWLLRVAGLQMQRDDAIDAHLCWHLDYPVGARLPCHDGHLLGDDGHVRLPACIAC